ncbi:Glycerol-3-phosphate regulon repressor [Thalassovita gelatinovora]|uniref:Glycerol-3-phosphate regulon repressor n=1 Tax=Thalassovita gelatinovora TaxID=53501 RepID=A0A0P1FYM7_THAGE|nr:DeoR/GlpR family DNA-binding transcription regulator [Thalassovita gelatinovora]QIZ80020.1 DeoR/GlpR transcriptional regulator [Thalassovita gelatinovora]CUH65713.1 Glycerol-3-phosphate regulon repressor [Thalassovita gelatinovora]SER04587.1 transcriptional regulator, DeoR family [Thalassovita gelatinovora]
MTQNFRHPEILDLARRRGKVSVDDLAGHFGVTVQTIRRDLTELADAGQLERVHGGAMLPSGVQNIGYDDRRGLNAAAKAKIAEACAAQIPEGASLFLNIGTTTEAVARALLRHRNLMVVTNNLNIANILAQNPDCDVIVAGGSLRRSDGGLTGSLTMRMIEQFRTDIAVIGCSALDESGDLLDFDVAEVGVSQTILAHARQRFVVADHSKWARSAPARITNLADIDMFFTDQSPPQDVQTLCDQRDTKVVKTSTLIND